MIDWKKALEVLEEYAQRVTPDEYFEDLERASSPEFLKAYWNGAPMSLHSVASNEEEGLAPLQAFKLVASDDRSEPQHLWFEFTYELDDERRLKLHLDRAKGHAYLEQTIKNRPDLSPLYLEKEPPSLLRFSPDGVCQLLVEDVQYIAKEFDLPQLYRIWTEPGEISAKQDSRRQRKSLFSAFLDYMSDQFIPLEEPAAIDEVGEQIDVREIEIPLADEFSEAVLRKYLPWAGPKLRIVQKVDLENKGAASYVAYIDVCESEPRINGTLRIVFETAQGQKSEVELGMHYPAGILKGDILPTWDRINKKFLFIDENETN